MAAKTEEPDQLCAQPRRSTAIGYNMAPDHGSLAAHRHGNQGTAANVYLQSCVRQHTWAPHLNLLVYTHITPCCQREQQDYRNVPILCPF